MEKKGSALIALRDTAIAAVVSFFFFYLGFGQFIFVFPLLLLSTHFGKGVSGIAIVIETVLVSLYLYFTRIPGPLSLPLMLFEMYIPLSLLAAGATWLVSERKSMGMRLFWALVPATLFFIILAVYLEQDPALLDMIVRYYQDAFEAILGPFLNVDLIGADVWAFVCRMILLVIVSMLIPLVFCFVCATCFTFESVLHSRESDWEDKVAHFELDGRVIWIFLALWLLVLLTRFVSIPPIAGIALFNITLSYTIVYAIQGFSVLYYNLRKRGRRLKSYTLFLILAAIALFVPGINIILVIALPLVGVVETFFELRK